MAYGFGYVWVNQGVQNTKRFLKIFEQRATDCWKQDWHDRVTSRERYSVYRVFKDVCLQEPYFEVITKKVLRDVFIRFRLGISDLRTHKLRYSTEPSPDLSCPLCSTGIDDEKHFLFVCSATQLLRNRHLSVLSQSDRERQNFSVLGDTKVMLSIARFIYHSLKLRI